MSTLLALLAFTFAFNFLLYAPGFIRYRRLKRQRALQEARAEIAACSTAFQKYLAEKHIICGQIVHDLYYEAINAAQFFDKYLAVLPILGPKRRVIGQLRREVEKEINELPPEISKLSNLFSSAYLRAAYYRHPIRFKILMVVTLFRISERYLRHKIRGKQQSWQYARTRFNTFINNLAELDSRTPVYAFAALWFIAIGVATYDDSANYHVNCNAPSSQLA